METAALVFGGIIVSLIVQFIKSKLGTNTPGTLIAVAIFSVLGGVAYYYLLQYNLWETVLQILGYCGAFYAFVIRNIEA